MLHLCPPHDFAASGTVPVGLRECDPSLKLLLPLLACLISVRWGRWALAALFPAPWGSAEGAREEQTGICQVLPRPISKRCHLFPATVAIKDKTKDVWFSNPLSLDLSTAGCCIGTSWVKGCRKQKVYQTADIPLYPFQEQSRSGSLARIFRKGVENMTSLTYCLRGLPFHWGNPLQRTCG